MLRTLGIVPLLLCIAWSAVFADETGARGGKGAGSVRMDGEVRMDGKVRDMDVPKPKMESASDQGTARMVRIEVLIADVKPGASAESAAEGKARIEQLEKAGKLDALTRVQLATVEGKPAFVQVGQSVAQITAVQMTSFGRSNVTTRESLGMIVRLTPQIRRDGRIGVEIQVDRSQLGPADEGTPIFTPSAGNAYRRSAPRSAEATSSIAKPSVAAETAPVAEPSAAKSSPDEVIRIAPQLNLAVRATISALSGESVVVAAEQTNQREVLIVVTPELLDKK